MLAIYELVDKYLDKALKKKWLAPGEIYEIFHCARPYPPKVGKMTQPNITKN
jgi:hypothetical protein